MGKTYRKKNLKRPTILKKSKKKSIKRKASKKKQNKKRTAAGPGKDTVTIKFLGGNRTYSKNITVRELLDHIEYGSSRISTRHYSSFHNRGQFVPYLVLTDNLRTAFNNSDEVILLNRVLSPHKSVKIITKIYENHPQPVNCNTLQQGQKCKDNMDIINQEDMDYDNEWMNYYRFVDDGTCIKKEDWRQYDKLKNPANRQKAVCDPGHDLSADKLYEYLRQRNLPKVRELIELGADPNGGRVMDEPPIFILIDYGATDLVELLIDKGADLNIKNSSRDTPLQYALRKNKQNIVNLWFKNAKLKNQIMA